MRPGELLGIVGRLQVQREALKHGPPAPASTILHRLRPWVPSASTATV